MATPILSPGIFVLEGQNAQVISAVSTSTLGAVGFTSKGPVGVPTIVTSYADFVRQFGGPIKNARVPLAMLGFFSNGGTRAYINRVLPADAVAATGYMVSTKTSQQIETGTGGATMYLIAVAGSLLVDDTDEFTLNDGDTTVTFRFDDDASVVENATLRAVAFTAAMTADQVADAIVAAVNNAGYTFTVDASTVDAVSGGVKLVNGGANAAVAITITETVANAGFKRATFLKGTSDTSLMARMGAMPTVADTMSLRWRTAGTAVAAQQLKNRADSALMTGDLTTANFDMRIRATSLPSDFDAELDSVVPGTFVLGWTTARGLITVPQGNLLTTGTLLVTINSGDTTVSYNRDSGGGINVALTDGMTANQVRDALISAINAGSQNDEILAEANGDAQVAITLAGAAGPISLVVTDGDVTAVDPGALTLACSSVTSGTTTTTNSAGTSCVFDHRTGRLSVHFSEAQIPTAAAITGAYTPASSKGTATVVSGSVTGNATGSEVDATGAYDILILPTAPHRAARVLATYNYRAWAITPIAKGLASNDVRLDIKGNADFYTATTAAYSKFDVNVLEYDAVALAYIIKETYEELSFTDDTSASYMPNVISELSDFVDITEPDDLLAPTGAGPQSVEQLNGLYHSVVIAAGDESTAGKTVTFTLPNLPVRTRSLSITYTDSTGVARTIVDNGSGVLTGSVDATTTNTVVYATGVLSFTTANLLDAASLMTASWAVTASEVTHSEVLSGGTNGTLTDANQYGSLQLTSATLSATDAGIYALNKVEDLLQVIVPDAAGDTTMTSDILDYVDSRTNQPSGGDRFAILSTPASMTAQEATEWFRYDLNKYSKFAALYWPWLKVADPLANNRPVAFPSMGHVAGIYARTDNNRNVGKTPAGTVDGQLSFILGLEMNPTLGDRDTVYQNKINPIISSTQTGTAVWGGRTISNDSSWRYISVRRTFMFVEQAIYNNIAWAVFENNGPAMWSRLKGQLDGFLSGLYRAGILAGSSASAAFQVVVDGSNNPDPQSGFVYVTVSLATNTPGEFLVITFNQKTLS